MLAARLEVGVKVVELGGVSGEREGGSAAAVGVGLER
jgi:hypothetical protein